jgi:membrane protease subunit HflC
MARKTIAFLVAGAAIVVVGLSSVFTVEEQEQGLVLQFGAVKREASKPGLHFKMPFIENVVYFDKRVLDYEGDLGEVNTGDQKQTLVDTYTRYRIVNVRQFVEQSRTTSMQAFETGLLQQAVRTNVQAVFASVDLATMLTAKRDELMTEVTKRVDEQMKRYGISVLDVRVKRIDLPKQNSEAVFQRMETQRRQEATRIRAEGERDAQRTRAEADKRVRVIKSEAEKKGQILRGEGDGKALEIFNKAFSQDVEFFKFWQCVQSVRDGLGQNTRFVGQLTADVIWQLCEPPGGSAPPAKKAER